MFTVKVGLNNYRRQWQRTQIAINRTMVQAVTKAAELGIKEAKRGGFRDQTGRLRKDIHHGPIQKGAREEVFSHLIVATPYARHVEYGTKAHEIWPKEGGGVIGPLRSGQSRRDSGDIGTHRVALRWYVGGRPVFARMVHHPGTRPYHFMRSGGMVAELALREYLTNGFIGLQSIWN